MYFPTSGVDVPLVVPPLVGMVVAFFGSMGGFSGAFLLLPFQFSVLNYTAPSVSPTNQFYAVISTPGGIWLFIKEKRMVWPLAWCLSLTSLPGVFIGAIVRVEYLPDPAHFKLFAGLVLLYLGLRTTFGLLRKKTESAAEARFQAAVKEAHSHHEKIQTKGSEGDPGSFAVSSASINLKYITYDFYGETFKVSTPGVFTLSFIIGIIGGIYGIGGGAFIAPFMVAFFRLPVYTIAGASLFSAMITTVAGVLFYQIIAPFYPGTSVAPDWLLGLFFGVGGLVGMYLGARCQKFVPANFIKWMLAIVVMYMALSYFKDFFFP